MRKEYDFSGGVRGKYVRRYREGTNLVLIDPDLSEEFPNSEAVNRALRMFLETRKGTSRQQKHSP
ncbi:MAG: hypothetical protein WD733_09775 [Bryobacterales bacterium]